MQARKETAPFRVKVYSFKCYSGTRTLRQARQTHLNLYDLNNYADGIINAFFGKYRGVYVIMGMFPGKQVYCLQTKVCGPKEIPRKTHRTHPPRESFGPALKSNVTNLRDYSTPHPNPLQRRGLQLHFVDKFPGYFGVANHTKPILYVLC